MMYRFRSVFHVLLCLLLPLLLLTGCEKTSEDKTRLCDAIGFDGDGRSYRFCARLFPLDDEDGEAVFVTGDADDAEGCLGLLKSRCRDAMFKTADRLYFGGGLSPVQKRALLCALMDDPAFQLKCTVCEVPGGEEALRRGTEAPAGAPLAAYFRENARMGGAS